MSLPDVGHGPVRPDDDLLPLLVLLEPHHPAALVVALVLEIDGLPFLEQGEGLFPELQVEDAALAGQDVVADADAAHGRQMGPDDPPGNVAGHWRRRAPAVLDSPS